MKMQGTRGPSDRFWGQDTAHVHGSPRHAERYAVWMRSKSMFVKTSEVVE